MRRYSIGLIGLFGLAGGAFAQQIPIPMPMPTPAISALAYQAPNAAAPGASPSTAQPPATPTTPATPAPAGQGKKDDKKPADPAQPTPPPPLTFPTTNATALSAAGVAAAGTTAALSNQPNVYGDMGLGSIYTPYLVATLPNGQQVTILPGQTVRLPQGTTFNQNVPTQLVTTNSVVLDSGAPGNGIHQVVKVTQVQVTGTDLRAHSGGLPIDVVRGAFKIGENESPRPVDRIYATYNFFSDVNPSLNVPGMPTTNVHRETFGLEKTFLDGNASIGIRMPLLQIGGPSNIERQGVGDITAILKYALINDLHQRQDGSVIAGNCLSFGLAVTAPTGNAVSYSAFDPVIHSTILQPFVGAVLARDYWYLQGFSSIAVPTDRRDTTYFLNSLQLGYRLYEAPNPTNWVQAITPIAELHVNTPLNNHGIYNLPIGAYDIVSVTAGSTFQLGRMAYLNIGVNTPLTGPKPYVVEALAQLNVRY
ncbi:MAG: hypothetical protein U0798_00785 [Gemmataceae bacterium]